MEKFQPTIDSKEEVRVFADTSRKVAIKELLSQFPNAKILSITKTNRTDEYVYTLGVQDDHSYTVEGLLAENHDTLNQLLSSETIHEVIG